MIRMFWCIIHTAKPKHISIVSCTFYDLYIFFESIDLFHESKYGRDKQLLAHGVAEAWSKRSTHLQSWYQRLQLIAGLLVMAVTGLCTTCNHFEPSSQGVSMEQ